MLLCFIFITSNSLAKKFVIQKLFQTPDYTEEELVRLLKCRNKASFTHLYQKYSGALYNIILQTIPESDIAGDILQETFINIWNKFDSYDHTKGRLFTWMLTISRNLCIDMVRSKEYKNSLKNIDLPNESENTFYQQGITAALPESINYIGLNKAVLKLKPKHRELIYLAYFRGYTQSEIAGMEGVPKGTVKTRIRKALMELRQYLQ